MVRVISLLWTLALSIVVTGISYFYIQNVNSRGFPFYFTHEVIASDGSTVTTVNYWSVALDVFVWWILFSMVWIIVKNYILQLD